MRVTHGALVGLVYLYRTACSALVAAPVAVLLGAPTAAYPRGSRELFDPGAMMLGEALRLARRGALSVTVSVASIGVLALLGSILLSTVVLQGLATADPVEAPELAAAVARRAPTIAIIALVGLLAQAIAGAVAVLVGGRLFEMVASSVQGRDVATVASGVLALAGVALLGIVRDLASAAAVRRRQGFYDATVTALEALRANGSRVLAAWGVRGVAAIAAATLVFFAAPSGADGHRLAAPAAFLLHQFALGLVAALHVSWLRVALRRVEPSAHGP